MPGARLGDRVEIFTANYLEIGGTKGLEIVAWVSNTDEVKFKIYNRTGASVFSGLQGWHARVYKGPASPA